MKTYGPSGWTSEDSNRICDRPVPTSCFAESIASPSWSSSNAWPPTAAA
jgi:hypothetical protein